MRPSISCGHIVGTKAENGPPGTGIYDALTWSPMPASLPMISGVCGCFQQVSLSLSSDESSTIGAIQIQNRLPGEFNDLI